jgi:hypothetical protein
MHIISPREMWFSIVNIWGFLTLKLLLHGLYVTFLIPETFSFFVFVILQPILIYSILCENFNKTTPEFISPGLTLEKYVVRSLRHLGIISHLIQLIMWSTIPCTQDRKSAWPVWSLMMLTGGRSSIKITASDNTKQPLYDILS